MTLTLNNRSQNTESSLTQALRQIQQLNSKIAVLEQQLQDYVLKQQNLIAAIAEICISPMQEVQALRILIYRGEAACRQYLRSLLVKQRKNSKSSSTH
jgi:CII-binding regulator of phage lambda lysogenization HflD